MPDLMNLEKAYDQTGLRGVHFLKLKAPLFMQFELTNRCNQSCIFCYNVWKEDSKPLAKRISRTKHLKILRQIIKNEIFSLIFSGGEPLLVDWLEELIEEASSNRLETSLITNAILLSRQRAREIKRCGLSSVQISLHHYIENISDFLVNKKGFKKTIAGIGNAIEFFGTDKVSVNMVILPKTVGDIYNTAKFLSGIGLKNFSVGTPTVSGEMAKLKDYVIDKHELERAYFQLIEANKDFKINTSFTGGFPLCLLPQLNANSINMVSNFCDAGLNQLVVDPCGNLRPCVCLNYNLGNILKDDLKIIWQDNKLLSNLRRLKYAPSNCKKCIYVHQCRGGCRASANGYYGSVCAEDPLMR